MMALLFLVAGLLTAPVARPQGPARFARDRLLRLGIPFAVCRAPGLARRSLYAPLPAARAHPARAIWAYFLTHACRTADRSGSSGCCSLLSLGLRRGRRGPHAERPGGPADHHARCSLAVAGLVALGRRSSSGWPCPYGGATPLDLNEWQWPECIALFAIGDRARAAHGLAARGAERLARPAPGGHPRQRAPSRPVPARLAAARVCGSEDSSAAGTGPRSWSTASRVCSPSSAASGCSGSPSGAWTGVRPRARARPQRLRGLLVQGFVLIGLALARAPAPGDGGGQGDHASPSLGLLLVRSAWGI